MSDRDDFERALCDTLLHALAGSAVALAAHRTDDDFYLFDSAALTGLVNIAWWSWREGRKQLLAQTPAQDGCHVLH